MFEQPSVLRGEAEVVEFEQEVRRRGYHTFRTDASELAELREDPSRLEALFRRCMIERYPR